MARCVDIIRLACALANAFGYKAAPMVQSGLADDLVQQIPDLGHPRVISTLPILSQLLEREFGDVSGITQTGEQCELSGLRKSAWA